MSSNFHRALTFQGGGSLGAYEAGAYKAINGDITAYLRTEGRKNEPIFHIVSGTSILCVVIGIMIISVVPTSIYGQEENYNYTNGLVNIERNGTTPYDIFNEATENIEDISLFGDVCRQYAVLEFVTELGKCMVIYNEFNEYMNQLGQKHNETISDLLLPSILR